MKKTTYIAVLAVSIVVLPSIGSMTAVFDHDIHTVDAELECVTCHPGMAGGLPHLALMPEASICLECHDEDVLVSLPEHPTSHAGDYRHQHQFDTRSGGTDCTLCHLESEDCSVCHHGENVDFLSHDRNWLYTHAVTGLKGTEDCASCHEVDSYCTGCHVDFGAEPGSHLSSNWAPLSGGRHAVEGRADLGSCMLCHDGLSPALCSGCHQGIGE